MDIFSLDIDAAGELASLTKGYPLPFRYLVISTGKIAIKRLWNRFCRNMTNIWMNMYTVKYGRNYPIWIKKIVTEMSLSGETQVKALRERLDMKSELFSVYRERLKRKGVIISKEYGKVTLALPRFDEFVKIQQLM